MKFRTPCVVRAASALRVNNAMENKKIILASASPRRFNLLRDRGYEVFVHPADIDESQVVCNSPADTVAELAKRKALAVADDFKDGTVVAADTVVCLDGHILGKPKDRDDAVLMLSRLSDNTHTVYTGVCIVKNGDVFCKTVGAKVTFHPLTDKQIEMYVDSGSPYDKAGAYGVQDDAGIGFVKSVAGELSTVVGLPMSVIIEQIERNEGK